MSTTTTVTATTADWATATTDKLRAFVQLKKKGKTVLAHVGSVKPAAGSVVGAIISDVGNGLPAMSFDAMESGDNLYLKALGSENVDCTVIASAAAGA